MPTQTRSTGRPLVPVAGGRPVAASIGELVAGADARAPFAHDDGKSGACLERVTIAGQEFVLKHLGLDQDWGWQRLRELAPGAPGVSGVVHALHQDPAPLVRALR